MGANVDSEGRGGAQWADRFTLMSGLRIEDLKLPSGASVEPANGPCGTILRGIDLADDLNGDMISLILKVFNHSGVLIMPAQHRLTAQRQEEVTKWFGQLFNRNSGLDDIPVVDGTRVQNVSGGAELGPHSDVQDYDIPPDATILHGIQMPPPSAGGHTLFANLFQAYDELPEDVKKRAANMRWKPATTLATAYGLRFPQAVDYVKKHGMSALESPISHPVVRTHPVSGRKALWVSLFTVKVVGIDNSDENKQFTEYLRKHATQPHLWYKHEWRNDDVIMWDNRCVNHCRQNWDHNYPRIVHRCQAGGSRPF